MGSTFTLVEITSIRQVALCCQIRVLHFSEKIEVTINRLKEKVREYEDRIEETAKVCNILHMICNLLIYIKLVFYIRAFCLQMRVKEKEKELQKIFADRERCTYSKFRVFLLI